MKIAIGTTNKLKIGAVSESLVKVFPEAELVSTEVKSVVSEDPVGDEEGIRGAIGRARAAMEKEHADMGVGAEGITSKNSYGIFVYGWVAIVDKKGKIGLGSSSMVMLPKALAEMLDRGEGLANAMASISKMSSEAVRTELGTNGILTKGMYDRKKEFSDATACALAVFVSDMY